MKRIVRALAALLFVGSLCIGARAEASSFTAGCKYDHVLTDDPIVFPNQPGASHSHDFFGNKTTDAFSTYSSLIGQATSCGDSQDTAAYWVPSAYLNGSRVVPSSVTAYYYKKFSSGTVAFPPGWSTVAGNSHATAPQSTSVVYFGCGHGSGISKVNSPPNCTGTGGHLYAHVLFPYCIDNGVNTYNSNCTGTRLPQLVERVSYPTVNATGFSFASGPSYTMHADFINSWNQVRLAALVGGL